MRFNFYKKTITLNVVISFSIILLSGCGTENSSNDNSSSLIAEKISSSIVNNTTKNPFGKYNPEIDISFVRGIDNDFLENVIPKTPRETVENNRWTKLYKEQLGINVKYDWLVKGVDAYNQKINVILASGNLPDVINIGSSQLKQLTDAHMITDMTEYYNDYASPFTKNTYTQEDNTILKSATFGGKLMGIPNAESSIEAAQYLWIRNDWLKKLRLAPPKTMNDLLKISEAFTTKDPDGNGKADTFGLAITKSLYNSCMGLEGFFAGFHSYPNFWLQDSSGKLVYGSILPETKIALKQLAEMYKVGQIDKEFALKNSEKVSESITAGKVGIEFGEQWNPMYPLINSFKNDNNADWQGYSLVSADNKPLMVPLKFKTFQYFAVKKGYSHPEAIIKLINMFLEKNWGKTNEFCKYYMPPENGNVGVWKFSPVTLSPPFKNLNAYLEIESARHNNDLYILKGESKAIQTNIEAYEKGDKSQWGWEKIYGTNGVFSVLKQYKENNSLLVEKFSGAPTKTMVNRKAALDSYENEEFTKIIMGEVPIDEFDKFASDWNKLGGADITKEVNDWYNSEKDK